MLNLLNKCHRFGPPSRARGGRFVFCERYAIRAFRPTGASKFLLLRVLGIFGCRYRGGFSLLPLT
jgi:hypothetical protein